jgi:hypothetical protein
MGERNELSKVGDDFRVVSVEKLFDFGTIAGSPPFAFNLHAFILYISLGERGRRTVAVRWAKAKEKEKRARTLQPSTKPI